MSVSSVVCLPGLVVDPEGVTVTWRGQDDVLGGRQMDVVYALALARSRGRRRLTTRALAVAVWGVADRAGLHSTRHTLMQIRRRFPGLIVSRRAGLDRAHELVISEEPA